MTLMVIFKTDFDTMRILYTHNIITDDFIDTWMDENGYDEKFKKVFKKDL